MMLRTHKYRMNGTGASAARVAAGTARWRPQGRVPDTTDPPGGLVGRASREGTNRAPGGGRMPERGAPTWKSAPMLNGASTSECECKAGTARQRPSGRAPDTNHAQRGQEVRASRKGTKRAPGGGRMPERGAP